MKTLNKQLAIIAVFVLFCGFAISALLIGFSHNNSEIQQLKKEKQYLQEEVLCRILEVAKYKNQSVIIDRLERDIEQCTTLKREYYKWLNK